MPEYQQFFPKTASKLILVPIFTLKLNKNLDNSYEEIQKKCSDDSKKQIEGYQKNTLQ